jgi:hypothetical protein
MPAKYYNITEAEMDAFLTKQGFARVSIEGTTEFVYGKRVDQDNLKLTLRVYTGIVPGGQSRAVGEDAIRVNLFMGIADGVENGKPKWRITKLGGSKRVHRVENWQVNLQKRLDSWLDFIPQHKCPVCGFPMIPRKGKHGMFLGCAGYPNCTYTKPINNA